PLHRTLQFAGGVSVGAVESTEAVIVLIALAAAGYAWSALLGAVIGGVVLLTLAAILHERIRRIKVPQLKLAGTSALFTFAIFWAGEGVGFVWPFADLSLLPLFVATLLVVRGAVSVAGGARPLVPVGTKG
ncbi:MAG: hypothetical protein L3K17_09320, partial [Thermoplasmata archaeon]|nr:hypothetical protein [Thermoplasmata archaeon]